MKTANVDLFLSRARALDAPLYQEFPPPDDLRDFVACTWVRLVRHTGSERTEAILPDGCADVMVYDDQPPCIAGPDAITRYVNLPHGLSITGIRIRPGACRAVLGCSAHHLVNRSVLLSDVAPAATALHHRLLVCENLSARLAILEHWVRSAIERSTANDHAVIAACRVIGADIGIEIRDLARRLDWNVRMTHRQFLATCGYGPKHFQRIMRVQCALGIAQYSSAASLGDVAAAAGYADQAHMSRDFRSITGFTPSAYFSRTVTPGWGAWLKEDW